MTTPSVTYSFSNSTTADATEVNQNFTDCVNFITTGNYDLTLSTITVGSTATFNGDVTIGNATSDTLTVTAYIGSSLIPATTATYDLGSTSNTWQYLYLDNTTTNGGGIYFNAGTTESIICDASGGDLDLNGFADIDFNSANLKGAAAGTFSGTCTAGTLTDGTASISSGAISGVTTFTASGDVAINTSAFKVDASEYECSIGRATVTNVMLAIQSTASGDTVLRGYENTGTHTIFNFVDNGGNGRFDMQNSSGTTTHFLSSEGSALNYISNAGEFIFGATSAFTNAAGWARYVGIAGTAPALILRDTDTGPTEWAVANNNGTVQIRNGSGTAGLTLNTSNVLGGDITNWSSAATQDVGFSATTGAGSFVKFTSSKRYKHDIEGLDFDSSLIYKMVPKQFKWNSDEKLDFGFIAEEVAEVLPQAVNYACNEKGFIFDDDGKMIPEGVKYRQLTALLLEELKKLFNRVEALESRA